MRSGTVLIAAMLIGCGAEELPAPDTSSGGATSGGAAAGGSTTGGGGGTLATGGSSAMAGTNAAGGSAGSAAGNAGAGGSAGGAAGTGGNSNPIDVGPAGTWVDVSPFGLESALGVAVSPAAPGTVYVNAKTGWPPSDPQSGLFKSTDGGSTWGEHLGTSFFNQDGSVYSGANPWTVGVSWTLAVDPTDADVVYAHCSFFGPQGPWKSTDGGSSWRSILSASDGSQMTPDIYAITVDPLDHVHLLMTFHSPWANGSDAGVAESTDGGATWIKHAPQSGWGAGHYAFFLGEDDDGAASSEAWILATQGNGFWRTMNGGDTWTQVSSSFNMQHGAGGLYRASTGVLYLGATSHLLRSTNNGQSWADTGAPSNSDGYNAVVGDGTRMYVQSANTGTNTTGPQTYFTSLETDGLTWTPQNDQTFADGPGWVAFDAANKIVYASHWDHGLWRLQAEE